MAIHKQSQTGSISSGSVYKHTTPQDQEEMNSLEYKYSTSQVQEEMNDPGL